MKELIPTTFEDLIAMNALYRPGPLEYIPEFINRKHGRSPIVYDLDDMQEYLQGTYGITVYQEQVMLLSQKLANFTKGQADMLRKAMGKKKKKLIDQLHPLFIEGGEANGHDKQKLEKVWKDWEAFASYAFNKSHSTCYAFVAFQTAYLKAHHPAEFMAAVLTNNKSDISKVTFFLKECKRMGLTVLGPDINESYSDFSVNQEGQIRFGLTALKGVGEGPVSEILAERKENGGFVSVYDMVRRLAMGSVNKRVMESLVLGGAFDRFEELPRSVYFEESDKYSTYLEHLLKYGAAYKNQAQEAVTSLFGGSDEIMIPEPKLPKINPWPLIEKLNKEKEVTGIFISGHPLDDFRVEIDQFTNMSLEQVMNSTSKDIKIAGIVQEAQHRISQKGTGWGKFVIQDFNGSLEFVLFKEDYQNFKALLEVGQSLFLKGGMEKRWNSNEMQFKVREVSLLESVGQDMTNSIKINIAVERLTDELIDELETLVKTKKGQHKLRFQLIDSVNRQKLQMYSKEYLVEVDNDFVIGLEKLGLKYKING